MKYLVATLFCGVFLWIADAVISDGATSRRVHLEAKAHANFVSGILRKIF